MQPSSFMGAIVPNQTSPSIIKTFREDGLQVEFYSEGQRQDILDKFHLQL